MLQFVRVLSIYKAEGIYFPPDFGLYFKVIGFNFA